jgi:HPt (histidine-containing phosphotransfer) domain-containing protein
LKVLSRPESVSPIAISTVEYRELVLEWMRMIAAGELDRATQHAHRARNDALMLSARPLQQVLTDLEIATRSGDEAAARAGLEQLNEVWPPTRAGLAAAAAN